MEVNVQSEINKRKSSERIAKVNENEKMRRDKKIKIKAGKSIHKPQFVIPEVPPVKVPEMDKEFSTNVKSQIISLMSEPAGIRKTTLEAKLNDSKFVNYYLDNKLNLEKLGMLNDHMKFGLIYGYNYLSVMK